MIMLVLFVVGCELEEVYSVRDTAIDCDTVSYANVGEPFMTQYCVGCHGMVSSNRQGAPTDVTLDSKENILTHLDTIREELLLETMPPSGGVTEEGIELVVQWLDCEEIR